MNNISPLLALSGLSIALIVIVVILLIAVIALYFIGRKAEKKQAEQQKTMQENSQLISLYVLDKKKLKLKDAGLPSIVLEQTPKYARRAKLPIVKVKAGPRVMNLIARVSGIYITSFKRIRGPVYEAPKKKKRFGRKNK